MSDEGWLPAEHGSDTGSLQRRVVRGLTWTFVDTWGRQLLSLVVFIILARLLRVDQLGLVALAAVFIAFAQIFVDQGFSAALIQRRTLTRGHIDTAFWTALATGAVLTGIGIVAAIPIAAVLGHADLQPILQVLSVLFLVSALSSVQAALLRRELAFRAIAIRTILAVTAGGAVGVAMAYGGFGVWALVGQQLIGGVVSVVALWAASPWRPGRQFSFARFYDLFPFGLNIMGRDTVWYFTRNTDNLLVGAFLGPVALGLYAVGYRILDTSTNLLVGISHRIAMPALSQLQRDPQRIQRAYLHLTRVAGAAILPGYVGLALVAPEFVVVVFGQKWADSGLVAAVLLLVGPVLSLQAFSGALLIAAGHPHQVFRFQLITMVVRVVGFVLAIPFGIVAVAAAFTIGGYLVLPYNLYLQRAYGGVAISEYVWRLRGLALATGIMAAVVLAVRLVAGAGVHPMPLLAAQVAIGTAAFVVAAWLLDRELIAEVIGVARHAMPVPRLNRTARHE